MALNKASSHEEQNSETRYEEATQERDRGSYRREEAPRASTSRTNPIPNWLSMSNTVPVPPEVSEFAKTFVDHVKTNHETDLKDFTFSQCSSPKSVYMAKITGRDGRHIVFFVAFASMISREIMSNQPKAYVLELARDTLRKEYANRGIRVVVAGHRVFTNMDLRECRNQIVNDIVGSLKMVDEGIDRSLTAEDLATGTKQFTVKSTDLNHAKDFIREHSPHAILPPMNAGVVLSWQGDRTENRLGGISDDWTDTRPVVAVGVMIDFAQCDESSFDEDERYTPVIRITHVEAIYPHHGLALMGLAFTIEKFASDQGWTNYFYNGTRVEGVELDPGNLFRDPDNKDLPLVVDPEDAEVFWRRKIRQFTAPVVTLDVSFGRRNIPFIENFAQVAQGHRHAAERVVQEIADFFCDNGLFRDQMDDNRLAVCEAFSKEHTGIISLKDNFHMETRSITILSAIANIVGIAPNDDVVDILLNPNLVPAVDKELILTQWIGQNSITPLYDTHTVLLNPVMISAFVKLVGRANLTVRDEDNRRSRVLFSGRNNLTDATYSGSVDLFSRNAERRHYRSEWADDAGDFMV